VGDWLDQWAAEFREHRRFPEMENAIKELSDFNGNQLLEHVTKGCPNKEEFNETWTKDPTHVLGTDLYIQLREWLGTGKSDLS
jgi:hypothetical protein